jgi:hypothetical protein
LLWIASPRAVRKDVRAVSAADFLTNVRTFVKKSLDESTIMRTFVKSSLDESTIIRTFVKSSLDESTIMRTFVKSSLDESTIMRTFVKSSLDESTIMRTVVKKYCFCRYVTDEVSPNFARVNVQSNRWAHREVVQGGQKTYQVN